eukprot:3514734-Heterocapsa_arctica.AAC.1
MDSRRILAEGWNCVQSSFEASRCTELCDLSIAGARYTWRSPLASGHPAGIPWMGLTPVPRAPAHLTLL